MAVLGVRHVLRDAEMLDLGILEHLVDRIDWAAWHAGCVEFADPGLGGFLFSELVDGRVERVAIFRAGRRGGVVRISYEFGCADRLRATLPDPPASGGDVDVTVGGFEHPGGNAGRVVVSGLL